MRMCLVSIEMRLFPSIGQGLEREAFPLHFPLFLWRLIYELLDPADQHARFEEYTRKKG